MRSFSNTLSVAPGYLCQWTSSSLNKNTCGTDVYIFLVRDADGQKLFDFQLQNLTDSETFSASLNIVVPLSNSATSSRSNSSAPIIKRMFSPSVKGGKNNPPSQVRQEPQKVKSQVMGSFSEDAVKQIEFESWDEDLINKELSILPTEVVWLWDLGKDSWLRVDLDKQEKEN